MPDGDASASGAGSELPRVEVSDRHRRLQSAAFALLLEDGRPIGTDQVAGRAGITRSEAEALLADFDAVGRARFDADGRVVGIAGLSIEATRHRLDLDGTIRWTWCALDAIGILGALGGYSSYTAAVPDSDAQLVVHFGPDGPEQSDAVVFVADGYGSGSVVETWCPTVNLFPDADAARVWALAHDVRGRPVPVRELAADAAAIWAPVVAAIRD